jgi:hypothetical protein
MAIRYLRDHYRMILTQQQQTGSRLCLLVLPSTDRQVLVLLEIVVLSECFLVMSFGIDINHGNIILNILFINFLREGINDTQSAACLLLITRRATTKTKNLALAIARTTREESP